MSDIKHYSSKLHNEDLSYEDYSSYEHESPTFFNVSESRLPSHERLSVEHVPELHHDKDGEEHAQLIGAESIIISVFEINQVTAGFHIGVLQN